MIFASKICSPLRKMQQGVAGFGLSVAAGINFMGNSTEGRAASAAQWVAGASVMWSGFPTKPCKPSRAGVESGVPANFDQGSCVACSLMPAKHGEKQSNIKSDSLAD